MTNKPMLSVERELLERLTENWNGTDARIELRALLDKPACKECNDVGYLVSFGQQRTCWACKPAAHHQGEPVALQHMAVAEDGKLRWMTGRKMQDCELYAMPDGSAIRSKLYAEQPAPVAVDAPSRDELIKMLRHFASCANAGQVGTAAMDFVARLNGVKPIEQAKTCCGSCPGGCVAGLNGVKP